MNMANKVEIVRGTTNIFNITVNDAAGRLYSLAAGEKVIFGIKQREGDTDLIFAKVAVPGSAGAYSVTINPADTADLDCGRYYYDVALQSGNAFYNIIESNPFIILPNITSWGCAE